MSAVETHYGIPTAAFLRSVAKALDLEAGLAAPGRRATVGTTRDPGDVRKLRAAARDARNLALALDQLRLSPTPHRVNRTRTPAPAPRAAQPSTKPLDAIVPGDGRANRTAIRAAQARREHEQSKRSRKRVFAKTHPIVKH